MFCNNCGSKLEESAKFCGKCGTVVIRHEQEVGEITSVAASSPVGGKELNGLGGWLVLLGLGLLVQPFNIIYTIFSVNLPLFL